MLTLLSIILIILSVLLILIVLVQPGKSDMIAGMTGITGQFNSVLGTKGATNMLSKITFGFAIGIIGISLAANLFFAKGTGASTSGMKKATTEGRAPSVIRNTNINPATAKPIQAQPQPQAQPQEKK